MGEREAAGGLALKQQKLRKLLQRPQRRENLAENKGLLNVCVHC